MRFVSPILFAVLSAVIIAFSVKNLQPIEINPWPFADPVEAPTYLVVFIGFLVGFLAGAVVAWVSGVQGRRRRKRKKADREMRRAMKRRAHVTPDDTPNNDHENIVQDRAPIDVTAGAVSDAPTAALPAERAVYTNSERD